MKKERKALRELTVTSDERTDGLTNISQEFPERLKVHTFTKKSLCCEVLIDFMIMFCVYANLI